MSESLHLADSAWKDAEAFVDQLESSGQRCATAASFYHELTRGMIATTGAADVSLWQLDGGQPRLLAREHSHASRTPFVPGRYDTESSLDPGWTVSQRWDTQKRLITRQRVDAPTSTLPRSELVLCLDFDSRVDHSLIQPVAELCSAVIGIALTVMLRYQNTELRQSQSDSRFPDRLIAELYQGRSLTESFAAITSVTAAHRNVDRVSLVRLRGSIARLVASSASNSIDSRSRQVRLLERLTRHVAGRGSTLRFTVGEPTDMDSNVAESLETYLDDSGCRQIQVELISQADDDETPIAAMVLERFRLPDVESSTEHSSEAGDSLSLVIVDAIRRASEIQDTGWRGIAFRFTRDSAKRKTAWLGVAVLVAIALLALVPADLKIPVDGKLVARHRARLFAPHSGTVFELPVHDGQRVKQGDPIVVLRSSDLELQETTLAGELATAKSRLAAILASKSSAKRDAARADGDSSHQQQVVETMIRGLQEQLELVRSQQASLTLQSPISGLVDRWDLDQSLLSRPVLHGQHLLDIVDSDQGWTVHLDIPDAEIGYVLQAQKDSPCLCTFSLRSNPTKVFSGQVQQIEPNAHISPEGDAVVRAMFDFDSDRANAFRVGATVTASVHCGTRPLGFVWFRNVIEWTRQQTWF